MFETLLEEANLRFPRALLTVDDVCELLSCDQKTIYNWTKRSDPRRRPPRIMVGKTLRFPKVEFIKWLSVAQAGKGIRSEEN